MRLTILYTTIASVVIAGIIAGAIWYLNKPDPQALAAKRLSACSSIPTNDILTVNETSRMFVNLPKDIYPEKQLETDEHGATAGYISNGGPYGDALEARDHPNCWSYYLEFDRTPDNKNATGSVDIISKSGVAGVSDYVLHVKVVEH